MPDLLDLADALPPGRPSAGAPALTAKVVAVDQALAGAGIPHAIGGALALAYYAEPRVTLDIDVNVFVSTARWPGIERALAPLGIDAEQGQRELARHRQARVPWGHNPVHLFFSEDPLHAAMPAAARQVPFAGSMIPIVSPEHLVIRKAMLDRPKDWLDIEAIFVAETPIDIEEVKAWLGCLTSRDDPRLAKVDALAH